MSEQHGIPGTEWREPSILSRIWYLIVSVPIALMVTALIAGMFHVHGGGVFVLGLVVYVASNIALASGFRSRHTRDVWFCPRCGAQTDPRFEVCRSCGLPKA